MFAVTLQDAVKETLATNPTIQAAIAQRNSREGELQQARAGYKPTIDLTASIGYGSADNSSTQSSASETHSRSESAINLRQMIFDGFATRSEVARQTERINSAAYAVYGTAENTGLRATEVYLNVLRQEELVKLATDNLATHERIADQIILRADAGVGRKSDQNQVEGRRALATSNLISAQTNLTDARTNYQRVIGNLPGAGDELEKPEFNESVLPATVDDAVQQAVAGNPTLKSSLADVEATIAQHKGTKSTLYPRFDLEIGETWSSGANGIDGNNNDASALIRMRYNLYRGGADVAKSAQAANLVSEAQEISNNTYRQVVESMRLSWNAYEAIETQLVYLRQHVESTSKTREAYAKQFNIGQRSLLDLLDSENELFSAARAVITAEYDKAFAQYRIMTAMGKLLEQLGLALPEETQPISRN
ncbi:MAG: TolC family outer membrane protein [Gammaproteobacteria bacterium]